jgi:hypothetical protein
VLLYHFLRERYQAGCSGLTAVVYLLTAVRVVLCLFPQNDWFGAGATVQWGICRNIPFAILGVIIIVLFFRRRSDKAFRFMWLAITLSFAFYIPVVLFASMVPAVGMLMIPKTIAYVWMIWMGYRSARKVRPSL